MTDNHVVIVPIGFLLVVSVVAAVYILFVPVNTYISWLCPYEKKRVACCVGVVFRRVWRKGK